MFEIQNVHKWTTLAAVFRLVSFWVELYYDRRSVGQSFLVSSPHLGLMTRFFLLSDHCGFLIWGALSDEMTGLSFTMYNIQYILLSQIWDQVPVFISSRNRVAWLYPQALGNSVPRCIFLLYNLWLDLIENKYCCRFYLGTDCISKDTIPVDKCLLSRCLAADIA
jgi:hypothetical protein